MNRIACTILFAAVMLAPAARAWADEAPTPEQIEAAKKAYGEGKTLHDAGNLQGAVEKFKESYRLSRNPLLLYNIAVTLDEAKQTDDALFYYRKFLSDAPPNAAQRGPAQDRVKVLENEKLAAEMGTPMTNNTTGSGSGQTETNPTPKPPTDTQPPPTQHPVVHFEPAMFKHELVDDAPPNKPLDITAAIPEGADVQVILYYRPQGANDFVAKPMRWHDNILIARIPAAKVSGLSLQYYIEVKDGTGKRLAGSGKPTEPNLVSIDANAQPHTFGDYDDDAAQTPAHDAGRHDTDDSPALNKPLPQRHNDDDEPTDQKPETSSSFQPGSKSYKITTWSVTGGAVLFLGLSIAFDVMAGQQAKALANDSTRSPCGPSTCTFDGYDAQLQSAGKRDAVLSDVTLSFGLASAAVAGYFWYRTLTHHSESRVVVAPELGQSFMGAAAAVRF